MEKLKSSLAAKIAAVVLIIVSLAITVAGFAGMAMMDAVGGYQIHKDDMLKKAYEEACTNYSVAAMAGYLEQYDADELMQTNFRYGIVKADNLSEVDFADRNSYIIWMSFRTRGRCILKNMILPKIVGLILRETVFLTLTVRIIALSIRIWPTAWTDGCMI